jgi:hypothetical protein
MRSATPMSKAARQRRTERRELTVPLDGTAFREGCRAFWRGNPNYRHLADAMEPGRAPSAPPRIDAYAPHGERGDGRPQP